MLAWGKVYIDKTQLMSEWDKHHKLVTDLVSTSNAENLPIEKISACTWRKYRPETSEAAIYCSWPGM